MQQVVFKDCVCVCVCVCVCPLKGPCPLICMFWFVVCHCVVLFPHVFYQLFVNYEKYTCARKGLHLFSQMLFSSLY